MLNQDLKMMKERKDRMNSVGHFKLKKRFNF